MAATFATCTFNRVWLLDPAAPTVNVISAGSSGSLGGGGSRSHDGELDGEFREYASGRVRFEAGKIVRHNLTLVLRILTQAQVAQLRKWRGKTLLVRDSYGNRMFGVFTLVQELNIPFSTPVWTDVALSFTEVTYPELVF